MNILPFGYIPEKQKPTLGLDESGNSVPFTQPQFSFAVPQILRQLVSDLIASAKLPGQAAQGKLTDAQMQRGAAKFGVDYTLAGLLGDRPPNSMGAGGVSKKIAGAPPGVMTPQAEAAARNQYLRMMEEGAPARHWYDESGQANLYHMGGDPTEAAKFTGAQAATSSSTAVDPNLGHAIRGHNQSVAGDPVRTGRYPNDMGKRIESIYAANTPSDVFAAIGPKIGPYAENIAKGGGYATTNQGRAVHDIWDARVWGYKDPDGALFSGTPGAAQHRWMDQQMKKVIDTANKRGVGGASDWNERSAQAAAWISGKAKEEGTTVAQAGRNYSDLFPKYYGQGSWESVPGRTTDHLPGLASAPIEARREHLDAVSRILTDPGGRDVLARAFGLPTGKTISGPGVFEGSINPGKQAQYALGRATGGATIDPASEALANSVEATRGGLLGQDAAAWHLPGNAGEAASRAGVQDFTIGSTISDEAMRGLIRNVQEKFGPGALERIAPIPTKGGFRLLNFGENPKNFASAGNLIAKELGIEPPVRRAILGGNLISNNWKQNPLGQAYWKYLDRPRFIEAFNRVAPPMANKLHELDSTFVKQYGGPAASEVQKLRKVIANEGYDGLMRAIKAGSVTVGAVGVMLDLMGHPLPSGARGTGTGGFPRGEADG